VYREPANTGLHAAGTDYDATRKGCEVYTALVLNVPSLLISLIALLISAIFAHRQTTITKSQLVMNFAAFWTEVRQTEFVDNVHSICNDITKQHEARPISDFPIDERRRIQEVVNLFDHLGLLIAFDALEEDIVISMLGNWLDLTWRSLETNIRTERRIREADYLTGKSISSGYLVFFEHLVYRARKNPPPEVQRRLGLKRV
jgi:hypothetical protein